MNILDYIAIGFANILLIGIASGLFVIGSIMVWWVLIGIGESIEIRKYKRGK